MVVTCRLRGSIRTHTTEPRLNLARRCSVTLAAHADNCFAATIAQEEQGSATPEGRKTPQLKTQKRKSKHNILAIRECINTKLKAFSVFHF
jgi:hypothetical protein